MNRLSGLAILFLAAVLVLSGTPRVKADKMSKPQQPRYVEFLASQSVTQQEDMGTGALSAPVVTLTNNKPDLTVQLTSIIKCGSSGNGAASDFTLAIRMDGVVVYSLPVSVVDNGFNYRYVPININTTLSGVASGTHVFDVFITSANGLMVVVYSSPTSPTTLNVFQQ